MNVKQQQDQQEIRCTVLTTFIEAEIDDSNKLRHPVEGNTTGWYIWVGEDFSTDPDFFVPPHVKYLEEWCPMVLKYLSLAPGWRFLVTENYEDVWEDKSLLES